MSSQRCKTNFYSCKKFGLLDYCRILVACEAKNTMEKYFLPTIVADAMARVELATKALKDAQNNVSSAEVKLGDLMKSWPPGESSQAGEVVDAAFEAAEAAKVAVETATAEYKTAYAAVEAAREELKSSQKDHQAACREALSLAAASQAALKKALLAYIKTNASSISWNHLSTIMCRDSLNAKPCDMAEMSKTDIMLAMHVCALEEVNRPSIATLFGRPEMGHYDVKLAKLMRMAKTPCKHKECSIKNCGFNHAKPEKPVEEMTEIETLKRMIAEMQRAQKTETNTEVFNIRKEKIKAVQRELSPLLGKTVGK